MEIALFLSLGALLGVLGLGGIGLVAWLRRLRDDALAELDQIAGPTQRVDPTASCLGRTSAGLAQIRGNGCLGATDDALIFVQWLPRSILRIPRDAITSVETPRSHLGKRKGTELLRVSWRHDGTSDSVAWAVRDLRGWLALLDDRSR